MKTVLITGAGSGIGQATALEFAKNSYQVILIGRNIEKLKSTQSSLSQSPVDHISLACDIASKDSLRNLIQSLNALTTTIDVLVNNAGLFERNEALKENSELWARTFATNLFGTIELTEAILPKMMQQNFGSIVNVSSTLGLRPVAGTSAYSASKAALWSWTQTLAIEGAPHNIRVNCVSPGIIDTPIHAFHRLPETEKAKSLEQMKAIQPLSRVGHPSEVAEAIYFLGSEKSKWTTGTNLNVDGGISLV